ncbi:MAG: carboxymuconolactone decarboxylase family protein [Bacteroidia bacterium]
MNQPLINPTATEQDEELQKLIRFFDETLGFCPNSVKTMYIRPRIAYAFIELNKAVMENNGGVSSSLKRLIGYISSYAAGCRYCQAHTIRAAERYGAEQQQLENIWSYKTHPAFSDAEKAALDFALAASVVPNAVDETITVNLKTHWNEGEIVEILGVIALFGFLNRWNDSMATQLETPAIESGQKLLKNSGWSTGKHAPH